MKTRNIPRTLAASLAIMAMVLFSSMAIASSDGVVTQSATGSFDSVVTKLKKSISANKLVIVKEVPFTQMLAMVGVKAEKILSFEIFHPRFGKAIYANDKNAMVDVPLRILVRENDGATMLQYRKPSVTFASYSALSSLGIDLDVVFAKIIDAAAK